MSNEELQELKEQIKQEILREMNTKKENENTWNKIKNKYKDEFRKFNFIDHWEFIDTDNRIISHDEEIIAEYPIQNAIGTLLRIIYKSKTVNKMNVPYEEAKRIVEDILGIMKDSQKKAIQS